MSEFLVEARILVRPDTSRFRTDLEAQLKSITQRPIPIPIIPVVGPGFAAAAAGTAALAAAQGQAAVATANSAAALASATTIARQYTGVVDLAAVSTQALGAAQEKEALAARESAAANAAAARSQAGLIRGAGASALTLFGLRGATLAASGAFLAGTAAVVAFSKSVQSAAQLETELNVFRVTAGATADEMDRVAASARQLGRDITLPGVTASTAATAMTELAKAGLSVQDALDGARGTLQLATAAQIDVKSATELVAGALNSFKLQGTDAVKVADLLTGAAKESQGEITDMATALAQASAVSRQFGVSIEDTVTLLTELAQAGISGGRAGTSLRVAFLRLVNPPADAAKALKELNVQIRDAQGNLRPQVFTDISDALQGYSKAQRDATLATIFGSDAIRAAGIIGAEGAASFRETRDAITEVGLAQEAAAARTSGLQGDIENLNNQVSSLGLTFGQVAKGPVSAFVKAVADSVSTMNDAATGAVALGTKIRDVGSAFANTIPFVDRIGLSFGDIAKATSFLNPLTGQLALAAKAAQVFGGGVEEAGKKAAETEKFVFGLDLAIQGFQAAVKEAAAARDNTAAPATKALGVKQIQNIIGGFDAQEVRAKIAGDNAKLVDVLNTEQAFLERQLNRDFVKRRPALQRAIEQALLGVVNDLGSIKATAAAATARLKAEAKRVAEAQAKALADAAQERRDRIAKAVEDAKQAQQAQQQAIEASLTLDISFAQTNNNQSGEIKAREALIKQLKKEQALTKRGTNEWKTLRNDIAEQNAAIDALNKEKKKQEEVVKAGQSFAQATFAFLQAQQGFASNLLGNLIPTGATGGLVGGGSVSGALAPVAGAADARSQSGVTSGQGNATNHILASILQQLKILNGDNVAPEATRQNSKQRSTMDFF